MNINISMVSQIPIYEQIETQLREKVLSGELKSGECLPSIRLMAKELRVGIITMKRAYEDLCAQGLLVSVPGKGVFVSDIDSDAVKEAHLAVIREQLMDIVSYASGVGITKQEIIRILEEE